MRALLAPGDALLLGTDLVKPVPQLLAAYDDPIGVTAAFNLNLLARINRELGADFDLAGFAARGALERGRAPRRDAPAVARRAQAVAIPGARPRASRFSTGETIWTESSHKYALDEPLQLGQRDRLRVRRAVARRASGRSPRACSSRASSGPVGPGGTRMTTWIALLRAINLAGLNRIRMSDSRELLAASGYANARTLLQSGNVVFEAESRSGAKLEAELERATDKRLGVDTDYLVRSAKEWESLVAHNPFPAEAKRDPGHLLVVCMKRAPKPADVATLQAAIRGPELVRSHGKQLYVVYPAGVGR